MTILLKDFNKQQVVTKTDVANLLYKIPKQHISGLKYIVYDPSRFFQRSYVIPAIPSTHVKGAYQQEIRNAIMIYEIKNVEQFSHILYHEIGHYMFNNIITTTKRKKWVTTLHKLDGFVSEYAKTNAVEDFAECYAYYFNGKKFRMDIQRKYHFIQSI